MIESDNESHYNNYKPFEMGTSAKTVPKQQDGADFVYRSLLPIVDRIEINLADYP